MSGSAALCCMLLRRTPRAPTSSRDWLPPWPVVGNIYRVGNVSFNALLSRDKRKELSFAREAKVHTE